MGTLKNFCGKFDRIKGWCKGKPSDSSIKCKSHVIWLLLVNAALGLFIFSIFVPIVWVMLMLLILVVALILW